ncbi:MAG: hypothetical protein ABIZ34_05595 [Candidatus Limnocylindrales bacterium]
MTIGKFWKSIAERVNEGEREESLIPSIIAEVLADHDLTVETVRQMVTKRVRDLVSSHIKPAGATSRVPAGQEVAWPELEAVFAVARLRRQVKLAAMAMSRARIHAEILGYIDASGIDIATFGTFGELCAACNVPGELVESLAA